ncbi:MAG: hypothetical protein IAC58_07020 [Firmicutes bacterium]|uniref:Uncharacterized protein n=1 Tax=Candidatus Onthovivens merdipullorum TaxID=2840889 RepID=A0A9D9DJC9_9BACL|nr:hypothetical protein [Candidatus Onthovivens merdipullorum]
MKRKKLFVGLITVSLFISMFCFNTDVIDETKIKLNFVDKNELSKTSSIGKPFEFNVVKNQIRKASHIGTTDSSEENFNYVLASTYNFAYKDTNYKGEIYLDENYGLNDINYSIEKIKDSILNQTYYSEDTENNTSKFNISSAYHLQSEVKITAELKDSSGEYFGSFASWRCVYQNDDYSSSTAKENFIVTYEDYISPNQDKTDYRTDYLSIYFNPNTRDEATLRDYSPKAQNPTGTISVSISSNDTISSNGTISIGTGASASYSTNISSPAVYDKGNMVQNYAQIDYDYLYPKKDKGPYYEYNIGQSCQLAAFRFYTKQRSEISIKSPHTITILRDGFWSNKTLKYTVDCGTGFYVH